MKALISRHWSDISDSIGVLCGFVNFFGLQNPGLSPEVSFVSGYSLTYFLNQHFHDTIEQDTAKNISHMVQTFEEK